MVPVAGAHTVPALPVEEALDAAAPDDEDDDDGDDAAAAAAASAAWAASGFAGRRNKRS